MGRSKSTEPKLQVSESIERDIWESAGIMVKQHGDLAAIEAAKLADHYLEIGDIDMQRALLRVVRAIGEINDLGAGAAH